MAEGVKEQGPVLQVNNICMSFGSTRVLSDVAFKVKKGEAIAIIGPSGAGKTTLLKCINLLIPIDSGEIVLDKNIIACGSDNSRGIQSTMNPYTVRRRVGMVFQEFNLWPNKTIQENIAEGPLVVLKQTRSLAFDRATKLCMKVGLEDKIRSYPHELSGGQRQRAAIARALAMDPEVLMLDEVTSALDPSLTAEVLEVMASLKDRSRTLLVVTHHIEFAKSIGDRLLFLREGRVHEIGPTKETLESPRTCELRDFLKGIYRIR